MSTENNKMAGGIALLLFPFDAGTVFSIGQKISNILSDQFNAVYVISSDFPSELVWPDGVVPIDLKVGRFHLEQHEGWIGFRYIKWLIRNIYIQYRMGLEIFKRRGHIRFVFCAIGGYFQIPLLIAKLMRKYILVFVGGEASIIAEIVYGKTISKVIKTLTSINYSLSEIIIVESDAIGKKKIFRGFEKKVRNGALYFGDKELFVNHRIISARDESIGFIGRMSSEKGILEFIEALPILLQAKPNLKVYLIGSGPCDDQISELITGSQKENVIRLPWVANHEIPKFLNEIKLLVIPSKTEGLPNILLEAISCGTPVLATRAGGIPDLITEGDTGYLLDSLEASIIAERILAVLGDLGELQKSSARAKELLDSTYSMNASVKRYAKIFSEFNP